MENLKAHSPESPLIIGEVGTVNVKIRGKKETQSFKIIQEQLILGID